MRLKPEEIQKQLYELSIGEYFAPDNNSSFTRVPGGWVYGDMQGTCFIPYISYKDRDY